MAASIWRICSLVCLLGQLVAAEDGFVEVQTSVGRIRGAVKDLGDGKTVNQYYGVPYAKPPVGELRWKETVPVEPWEGVYDASKLYPPYCPQIVFPEFEGAEFKLIIPGEQNEDCLYLSIYTPAYATPKSKLPVLFAIHGGGYSSGTGMNGDGSIVAAYTDVVVVLINYRLGILGFARFPSPDSSGNYGMFDQITALKWIKDNIENFGGDPESITIYGVSAGGMSVSLLTVSPLSKGLFQRAVSQSGAAAGDWSASQEEGFDALNELGTIMNCTGGLENVQACLHEKTPDELLQGYAQIQMKYPLAFFPRVDGKFLLEHPLTSLEKGNIHDVDQMIGICKDEGDSLVTMLNIMAGAKNISQFIDLFTFNEPQHVRDAILFEYRTPEDESNPDQELIQSSDFVTDCMFKAAAVKTAELVSKAGKNVHYYEFAHRSRMTVYPDWTRVPHGGEINYMMGVPFNISGMTFYTEKGFTEMEKGLSRTIMKMWSNFAKTGNPSIPEDGIDWPKFTVDDPAYMEITLDPTVKRGIETRRTAFWNDYIPKLRSLLKAQEAQPEAEKTDSTKDEL